jgi:hypothetical protein
MVPVAESYNATLYRKFACLSVIEPRILDSEWIVADTEVWPPSSSCLLNLFLGQDAFFLGRIAFLGKAGAPPFMSEIVDSAL